MKTINKFLLVIMGSMLACHSGTYKHHAQNLQEFTINHDGYQRSYFIYVPTKPGINGKIPLLFALHGGGGTAKGMPGFTLGRFHELAEEHGFIVVYPQGVEKQWNDGRKGDQVKAWKENIDDVGFFGWCGEEISGRISHR